MATRRGGVFGARAPAPGGAMPGFRLHAERMRTPSAGGQPAPTASRRIEPALRPAPVAMSLHRLRRVAATTRARPRVVIVAAAHAAILLALLLIVPARRSTDGAAEPATVGVVFAPAPATRAQAPSVEAAPPTVVPEPEPARPAAMPEAAPADHHETEVPAEPVAPRQPAPRTAMLPKVWTPSIQPTPDALPVTREAAAPPEPTVVDQAWAAGVGDWLVRHRSEPTDPRLRNVHAVVVIRFRVAPDGQVLSAWVLRGSGNRLLDQAALALVRGTKVPPFPPDMGEAAKVVTLPIRYDLD